MILPQDLRIGNIVWWRKEEGLHYEINMGDFKSLDVFDRIDGIELTGDVLEKCGFKNDFGDHFVFQNGESYAAGTFFLSLGEHYCQVSIGTGGEKTDHIYIPKRPKYLHQLMNLYYSLTGKELNPQL